MITSPLERGSSRSQGNSSEGGAQARKGGGERAPIVQAQVALGVSLVVLPQITAMLRFLSCSSFVQLCSHSALFLAKHW